MYVSMYIHAQTHIQATTVDAEATVEGLVEYVCVCMCVCVYTHKYTRTRTHVHLTR